MREGLNAAFEMPSHLPPPDAWKENPAKIQKFYAPVDDRGFVLPDQTIEKVQDLFRDDYVWPVDARFQQTKADIHHFHWIGRLYKPDRFQGRSLPSRFRELPTVKGIVPRQFHNVIHAVTLPPNVPKYRNMDRHYRAYKVASRLYRAALAASATRRNFAEMSDDPLGTELLIRKFNGQFQNYQLAIETALSDKALGELGIEIKKLPKRPPNEVARLLGKVVIQSEINYIAQLPHQPLAA